MPHEQYTTVAEVRALGEFNPDLYPDAVLAESIAVAVDTVETYTGDAWPTSPPARIRWAVRTLARQWLTDLHSRLPDRATRLVSEFGETTLAQAGGPFRPTSLPEVNAALNAYLNRPLIF